MVSQEAWQGGTAGASLFATDKSAMASFMHSFDLEPKGNNINVVIVYPLEPVDTKTTHETGLVAPKAIVHALLQAVLADEGGKQLEILIRPPGIL